MSKLCYATLFSAMSALALSVPLAAQATTLGPAAQRCDANESAALVEVAGFKARTGTLRIQIFASSANRR